MMALWDSLSALTQDYALLVMLLLPSFCIGAFVLRGYAPWPLVGAILWRFRGSNISFVLLVTVSVGMGLGLSALERGLRQSMAASTDKFDLLVTAPGSKTQMMLATVFLEPTDMALLNGTVFTQIAAHENVAFAAPLAFGDSYGLAPLVGTTANFINHFSNGQIQGRLWQSSKDALIGALAPLEIGQDFIPNHGVGLTSEGGVHGGDPLHVVGRMPPTGTPWDQAILVPIETVWDIHGLANGHAPDRVAQIGGPFDAAYFPGTPVIIIQAKDLWSNYALRSEFTRKGLSMAFFPATVLGNLFRVMAHIRTTVSVMSVLTQAITVASVLLSLLIISRLFQRQMSLLRALGAPKRFAFAVFWLYCIFLLAAGAFFGFIVGMFTATSLSYLVGTQTGTLITAPFSWVEIHYLAGFISIMAMLALLPALTVFQKSIIAGLRL